MAEEKLIELSEKDMPDFSVLENRFTFARTRMFMRDIGMAWDYYSDYMLAFELHKIRSQVSQMNRRLVWVIATSERDQLLLDEDSVFGEKTIDLIASVYADDENLNHKTLKAAVLAELDEELASAGDWERFMRYCAFIAETTAETWTTAEWQMWEEEQGMYDARENGYWALLRMIASFPVRRTLGKDIKMLPLGKEHLNGSTG